MIKEIKKKQGSGKGRDEWERERKRERNVMEGRMEMRERKGEG